MKYSKKELTDDEKLASTVSSFKEHLASRQKTLVYIAGGALVLLILIAGVFIYHNTTNSKAAEYEAEGYKLFYSASGENASALYAKALESFKKAYDTKKSAYSLFYIASCYSELGRIDEAINSLNELTDRFSDSITLSLAYNKLSALYLKKNDALKALDALDKLKKLKGASLQDLAYLQSAGILESIGKTEEAKAQYKELTEKFPNSLFSASLKAKIEKKKE